MKRKSILIFAAMFSVAAVRASSPPLMVPGYGGKALNNSTAKFLTPYVYDLDSGFVVNQNVNEKGLVVVKGNFYKPNTSDNVKLTVKYKDAQNNWVTVWCRSFAGNYEYNEELTVNFELPASALNAYTVKVELSSDSDIANWQTITWDKMVTHYKQSNYTYGNCDLDENQYTILFTPKKNGTVLYNPNGSVSGVKDRVTSQHLAKKLDNTLSFQGDALLDNTNTVSPVINITNPNSLATIASSQKYIYQGSDASPFEFSYHDPVYMFAGKFSNESFFINFSNWFLPPEEGGEQAGRGYLDFTNPNALINRYYNLYNYINEKLGDIFADQQPVVIVISKITGLRIYKNNGQYISLTATSNYNTQNTFGYPPLYDKHRGPGSENFSLSNTSQASLYGVGAIRNTKVINSWNGPSRPLMDIEDEINKFISYVGIFGAPPATECSTSCFSINPGAESDYTDWTKAPNSYIFTGKDKDGNNVEGLYIPVKKAYEMWAKGRYMQNENNVYTPIDTNGIQTTSVYWEDVNGLIKSTTIEGSGEDAKIKVIIDKTKGEGNASIDFKVNNTIYWSWHIWVTDNPEGGAIYGQGIETDLSGTSFIPEYMDRNLGATNAGFLGNDWNKSGGLMYQWGRKDPIPTLVYKDAQFYEITGTAGTRRHENAGIVPSEPNSGRIPVKSRGVDTPDSINGNIRYSINNPIHMITNAIHDGTWFSKQEYKVSSADPVLIETWDLWSDNRRGLHSNATSSGADLKADSRSYELKSEFDPCPSGWRVPSQYGRSTINSDLNPYGRKNTGTVNDDEILANHMIYPDSVSPVLNGVKVYPGLGIDFMGTADRRIGILPTNGNYEYYGPDVTGGNHASVKQVRYQDQSSDGSLSTATYGVGGARATLFYSSPEDISKSPTGWNAIYVNQVVKANAAGGVRCMKDPNIGLLGNFNTQYVASAETDNTDYKLWTKEANSHVVMTGDAADAGATDKVLKISLKKAYAMQKLYLSDNKQLPVGVKNTPSVVWTTNPSLIKNVKITGTYPNEEIEVTLAARQKGNAVVAFHKGNNGVWGQSDPDKILWSWHIWAPITNPLDKTREVVYTTESQLNGGIKATTSGHIVNPTKSLLPPLTTIFMDRNLGALQDLPGYLSSGATPAVELQIKNQIQQSGGLHYQWGRKDPLPTFHNPGGIQNTQKAVTVQGTYNVFRQTNVDASGNVIYNVATPVTDAVFSSTDAVNGYSREWNTYKVSAGIAGTEPKHEKIRKVIKYATENPLSFLFRNRTGNETAAQNNISLTVKSSQVKDWISDENGQAQDRWGHAAEKSPYDPCPEGWRVPDTSMTGVFGATSDGKGSYAKGSSPWFYNGYNTNGTFNEYGLAQSTIYALTGGYVGTNNTITQKNYPGFTLSNNIESAPPTSRSGWVFNFGGSKYNIGNIPTTGIRGILGGNDWKNPSYASFPQADNYRYHTGLWTSSPVENYTGFAIGLSLESTAGNGGNLASGTAFYPQAAMSCRCAKIEKDANGKEIGRYDPNAIAVPQNVAAKAGNIFAEKQIEEIQKDNKKLTVFPNPVKNTLYINADDKAYYYQIYSVSGQLVKQGKFESKQADVSSLAQGVYLVRINNAETVVKIIKE
ncbi:hypothetical protein HNP38_003413 [Chryseobacterium defluvii]|uniref:Secretion system C-terminal sorting domain-containing protein n=1 Tax=Chryseobacterium defluvii TaxID=160396 RepID=A0A840KKP1_9FLAO|nr:T9SS type A sorting domain-containing protein [Chryseobacterium defluvii]MBB4808073.1 hypothetical protein [Chryseobacterium defluvii]